MKNKILLILLSLPVWALTAQPVSPSYEEGIAVYYADDLHGQATSYGEQYRREAFTAAHQAYPPGTILRVTRLDNGQSVEVRVNDKMAPDRDRKIILSRAAAMQIGLIAAGKLRVRIEKAGNTANLYSGNGGGQTGKGFQNNASAGQFSAKSPYGGFSTTSSPRYTAPPPTSYSTETGSYPPPSSQYYSGQGAITTYRSPAPSRNQADVVLQSGRALEQGLSGYIIQLASYDEGAHAVSYTEQLLKQGVQHVYIWQKDGKNRVVIARFSDKANAAGYLDNLRRQYLLDGIIVQLR